MEVDLCSGVPGGKTTGVGTGMTGRGLGVYSGRWILRISGVVVAESFFLLFRRNIDIRAMKGSVGRRKGWSSRNRGTSLLKTISVRSESKDSL